MANVLIVEDSKSVAAAHAYSLWELGHTVTFAYSAKEARDYFQADNHEVVLLDFDLPDGTGLEVFRALRQVDPAACVVMITGKGDECLAAQILKEGAKDYLTKSSELLSILPDVVDRVLQERAAQQQLRIKDQELKQTHEMLKQKVTELADANEQLRYEVAARAKTADALEDANNKLKITLEELGRSQSQMLQSEKMASMGQLAAGVAHEINNPTGFISSNLYTLSSYLEEIKEIASAFNQLHHYLLRPENQPHLPPSVQEICAAITKLKNTTDMDYIFKDSESLIKESQDGAQRIKNIVDDLKSFAHPGKNTQEYIDINANITSAINLVWHEIKYKASISKEFGDIPLVQCYPQMMSQVFMNLLLNATQAMGKEGTITIRTHAEADEVIIRIQDTGTGIAEEHLNKIFDPFFTTKPVGKGTGLGLKVVYDIIHKHNGRIEVKSTVGVGTEFSIHLPIEGAGGVDN